ncbi:class I SAM-dependent methyltransferase [Rubrivivax gelatinosus]|uniref:Methyltransferase family protein n=1 Tax=Rubrivivax gelatinosus TaxID=28068 RepID=A0A4R2M4R4_RUBGE|nr:class I SAM-dependent methyltransferase [Rubrivivax gelatinosus]MBK1687359.1 SAM-dependent methyltransferase [Rubrivivax gelatinosus]TCO99804.1 methyltransferase family protein [Rubrivivax gelatinosus]
MNPPTLCQDEYEVLSALVPLAGRRIVELGCGDARLVRGVLQRHPDCRVTALEVDTVQHAKNLAAPPTSGLCFVDGRAEAVPAPDASFDLALMLKSLHHVPIPAMAQALAEAARVLAPGGLLYVSEPVYDGGLNDIVRLYNNEGTVRAAAQAALDDALARGPWTEVVRHRFVQPVRYADFADFERRMLHSSFATYRLDDALVERVHAAFMPHCGPDGAAFERPLLVRLLRREAA